MSYSENLHGLCFHEPSLEEVLRAGEGRQANKDVFPLWRAHNAAHAQEKGRLRSFQEGKAAELSEEVLVGVWNELGKAVRLLHATDQALPSGAQAEDMLQRHLDMKDYQEIYRP